MTNCHRTGSLMLRWQRLERDLGPEDGPTEPSDGFEAFCQGDTQISDASRPIDVAEEVPVWMRRCSVVVAPARREGFGLVVAEALWEALDASGIPRDVLALVDLEERALGRQLISHPAVDRLILTGAYETAELFRSFRSDLPLLAETSGKNALIVTPSADFDLAAKDVAYSAFGHAGQKCSAASLVILVGSVAQSRRFRNQLVDAVTSLTVDHPTNPAAQMGPLTEPAEGKLLQALTTLEEGQSWLIEPQQLDGTGRLWSPGVRTGVQRGSEFHQVEYFGPVLGVMTAETLEEAVALQNEVEYGLTAGLHSLDPEDIGYWLEHVQAGNLYVNRHITGAIVQRQPFPGSHRARGTRVPVTTISALMTLEPSRHALASPFSLRCRVNVGTNAALIAPSANRSRTRFGMRVATLNASIAAVAPNADVSAISRATPSTRLSRVAMVMPEIGFEEDPISPTIRR